jgi:NAD(P)-dependent dehydrogenase (short-subunit alcohol dehydrogenase family)
VGLLDERVAIVTGAGRGLGRAHALALAGEGAFVVINDPGVSGDGSGTDPAPAELVVAEIEKMGSRAVANLDSCADWKAAENLVAQAVDTFGSLGACAAVRHWWAVAGPRVSSRTIRTVVW